MLKPRGKSAAELPFEDVCSCFTGAAGFQWIFKCLSYVRMHGQAASSGQQGEVNHHHQRSEQG
jgi:hypothetical protein